MTIRKIEEESERIAMETIHIVKKDLDSKTKLLKEVKYWPNVLMC